ncbi:MAG: hypothetical protein SGJ01_04270 [Gemmatimonadota bacterium]|nr:hypothetical protein [Gemmatimonadota bacterium]
MPLELLDPTSDELYWPPHAAGNPPLGTILVARLNHLDPGELPPALGDKRFLPWCPTCLVLPDNRLSLESTNRLLDGRRQVGLLIQADRQSASPTDLRTAICTRTPPSATTLAQYITRRTGHADIIAVLIDCFEPSRLAAGMSRSSVSRKFRDFGLFTGRDWKALHRLILASDQEPTALERLAHLLGLDPRTLRENTHRFLGDRAMHATSWPGW